MNILFPIGAFYPSQTGGPCNTLYWHTTALKSNSIDVTVVTTTIGIKEDTIVTDKFVNLECGKTYYGRGNSVRLKNISKVLKEVKDTDIIHLNSLFSPLSSITFFYCKLFFPKKKIIWSVRGELNKNALQFSGWKKKPFLWLYKHLNKGITYHSTSDEETSHIKDTFPNATIVQMPNLIAPSKRINKKVSNYLVYVGRIHPIKAIHKLIEALSLSEKFNASNFELHIIGKNEKRHDNYKKELIKLITDLGLQHKIHFKGHLKGEEKEKAYANAYALILPSETENFGNVVIEALNQGTPVIASTGTPWEILETYNAGFHVANSPNLLGHKINDFLMIDSESYNNMVSNCYNLVDEKFEVNNRVHEWITIYKKL